MTEWIGGESVEERSESAIRNNCGGRYWTEDSANMYLLFGWTVRHVKIHTVNFCSKNHCRSILGKPKEFTDL